MTPLPIERRALSQGFRRTAPASVACSSGPVLRDGHGAMASGAAAAGTSAPPGSRPASARSLQPSDDRADLLVRWLEQLGGRPERADGSRPFLLDGATRAWVVLSGHVDVFAVPLEAGLEVGARRHLLRVSSGSALFGADLGAARIGLLGRGTAETRVLRVERTGLERLAGTPELGARVASLVDAWVGGLSSAVERQAPPREHEPLDEGRAVTLPAGAVARTRSGVAWVRARRGSVRFLGRPDARAVSPDVPFPLATDAWLAASDECVLDPSSTASVLEDGSGWAALEAFNGEMIACIGADGEAREQAERQHLARQARLDGSRLEAAYARLWSILAPRAAGRIDHDDDDPLLAACRIVGRALDIAIRPSGVPLEGHAAGDPLGEIAHASRARIRRVALRGAWWTRDDGPLLGYVERDGRPVALIPVSGSAYALHDPTADEAIPVTADVAATLSGFAYTFYRRFDERPLAVRDLLTFGLHGSRRDLLTVILTGGGIGALGLLAPFATGLMVDVIIPGSQRGLLFQLGAMLIVGALATAAFQVVQGIAVTRVEGRLDAALQAAVVDRLFGLPTAFFRAYAAGDLGARALGITTIRQTVSRIIVSSILAGVTAVASFVALFALDLRLALLGSGLALVLVLVVLAAGSAQLRHQRVLGQLAGQLSGTVLQLINGIPKLRVAAAETRAFVLWAGLFAQQRRAAFRARTVANMMAIFSTAFPLVSTMAIFGAMTAADPDARPSIGTLLAFSAAFGQFVAAALSLGASVSTAIQAVPLYERARPILRALPELDRTHVNPGELHGEIEANHVSFRYQAGGPLILDDVSIHANPGEFVALVGPSGSGKSTLLRLLLGFERPDAGAILYDGHDLAGLDLRSVRRQIGVVLQSGRLMSGDIFSNVVGSLPLTLDDAWEAVRMAGLEEDIRQMPMGMHTVVGDGGSTLSGGQRQRLLIARAIASRPRLIFFDEATSALDNRTQEIVGQTLAGLAATRVVIAHRISTVMNADRIYVFSNGAARADGTVPP